MQTALSGTPLAAAAGPRAAAGRRTVRVTRAVAEPPAAVPFLPESDHLKKWSSTSWRDYKALQQPSYPDKVRIGMPMERVNRWRATGELGHAPPPPPPPAAPSPKLAQHNTVCLPAAAAGSPC